MGAEHKSAAQAGPDDGERSLLVDAEGHALPRSILWLGEPACHDPFLVGGKAASLSRLAEHYPVPEGFALTTSAFDLASGAGPSVEGATAPRLPAQLRADVAAAYRLLADRCAMDAPAVAVRSSA